MFEEGHSEKAKSERKAADSDLETSDQAVQFSMVTSQGCSELLLEANLNQLTTLMLRVINDGETGIRDRKKEENHHFL